jgi:hypothetical protein
MKRNGFKSDKIAYKYEISYSQGVILFDLIFGLFLIGGGLIFTLDKKLVGSFLATTRHILNMAGN